jgi:hypothetical protein
MGSSVAEQMKDRGCRVSMGNLKRLKKTLAKDLVKTQGELTIKPALMQPATIV